VFVVAEISLKNNNYSSGISNNALYFKLEHNGVQYAISSNTFLFPGYSSMVTFTPGNSGSNFYVFEVPSGIVLSNAKIVWDGIPRNVVHDPSQF